MTSTNKMILGNNLAAVRLSSRLKNRAALVQSTAMDRFVLVAAVVLLPFQEQISFLGGTDSRFSIMWIVFAMMGLYICLMRRQNLAKVVAHPVFLAAYVLLFVGFIFESLHVNSVYTELIRYAFMIGGALTVAALCRDTQTLTAAFYGYIASSVVLALFLIVNYYGEFSGSFATNLYEATTVRDQIFSENSLATGLNTMASIMAQGTVIALAMTLTAISSRRRMVMLLITLFCAVASFLPMSRGSIVMLIGSCAVVVLAYRGKRFPAFVAIAVIAAAVIVWVPSVVFTRLISSTSASYYSSLVARSDQEDADGRSQVYTAALQNFREYIALGVGAGNYWDSWASAHGLGSRRGVSGAHNSFLQVTIYWGLPGLIALLALVLFAYRCLPKRSGFDPLSLGLMGLACSLFIWMMMIHNLYNKEFSLGLGLLVGARLWIWPKGVVGFVSRSRMFNIATRKASLPKPEQPGDLKGLGQAII